METECPWTIDENGTNTRRLRKSRNSWTVATAASSRASTQSIWARTSLSTSTRATCPTSDGEWSGRWWTSRCSERALELLYIIYSWYKLLLCKKSVLNALRQRLVYHTFHQLLLIEFSSYFRLRGTFLTLCCWRLEKYVLWMRGSKCNLCWEQFPLNPGAAHFKCSTMNSLTAHCYSTHKVRCTFFISPVIHILEYGGFFTTLYRLAWLQSIFNT